MDSQLELIKRAYDANAFTTAQTAAGYVNPTYWDTQVLDHIYANLVMLKLGMDVTSRFPESSGSTFNVQVFAEPAKASSVAESASLAVVALSPTQVALSPSEYGIAYQVTDKELRRAFIPVMETVARDLGYGIAKGIDSALITTVTSGAGNTVTANNVASSSIASSDTIDTLDVLRAMRENAVDGFIDHRALVVNPYHQRDLTADTNFLTADKFGPEAAVFKGFVGRILGIPVYSTNQIAPASSKSKALLISAPDSFVYVFRTPQGGVVRQQYIALERYTTIAGTVDFDGKVSKPNAICTIEAYTA